MATVSAISVLTPAHARASRPTSRLKADSSAACWEWSRPVSASRSSLQWLLTATWPAATCASVTLKRGERSSPLSCADAVLTACSKPSYPVSEPQPRQPLALKEVLRPFSPPCRCKSAKRADPSSARKLNLCKWPTIRQLETKPSAPAVATATSYSLGEKSGYAVGERNQCR